MNSIKEMIFNKVCFIGKNLYKMEQTPEEEVFLAQIDKEIDAIVEQTEQETGRQITITEGDRYALRWKIIKMMLIQKGMSEEELDAIEAAVIKATDEILETKEMRWLF